MAVALWLVLLYGRRPFWVGVWRVDEAPQRFSGLVFNLLQRFRHRVFQLKRFRNSGGRLLFGLLGQLKRFRNSCVGRLERVRTSLVGRLKRFRNSLWGRLLFSLQGQLTRFRTSWAARVVGLVRGARAGPGGLLKVHFQAPVGARSKSSLRAALAVVAAHPLAPKALRRSR